MDAAAELGRNPVSKHQIQPDHGDEQADAGRDCRIRLTRPNSQARTGAGNRAHEQDWQPYPVDPYSCCMCDHRCRSSAVSDLFRPTVYSIEKRLSYQHRKGFSLQVGTVVDSVSTSSINSSMF